MGTAYHGWQRQPNANTVQQEVETCLNTIMGSQFSIKGAGRTDTGVHARELYAHFDVKTQLEPELLLYKLNSFLPPDIAIMDLFRVQSGAHARFDALERTYKYYISAQKDPLYKDRAMIHLKPLDLKIMNKASELLIGQQDFECFARAHSDVKTFICDVRHAEWVKEDQLLIFTITADRFLRNMVRAVVGTLLDVGLGKTSLDQFKEVLASKDRSKAGASAPAHGLFLEKIVYPDHLRDHE